MNFTSAFQVSEMPLPDALRLMRNGLPTAAFDHLAKVLALSSSDLAAKIGVPLRTLNDQKKRHAPLSVENSEKLVRVARLQKLGRQVFASDEAVSQWLAMPAPALQGLKPIDIIDTELGCREVEELLQALAHGVYL